MLRSKGARFLQWRNVYISAKTTKHSSRAPQYPTSRQEAVELDRQLLELRRQQTELRQKINEAKDCELQSRIAKAEGLKIEEEARTEEIQLLDESLQKPHSIPKSKADITMRLPASIRRLLPQSSSRSLELFRAAPTWLQIVENLPTLPTTLADEDVEKFVGAIPIQTRAALIPALEKLVPHSLRTQRVTDSFMAAYAERGNLEMVETLFNSCAEPTQFSYGHLVKALFRTRSSPESVLAVLKRMGNSGLSPSLPVLSTAIQSFIQHKQFAEAESLFDNMKYWAVDSQPDLKLYNKMILSAAMQHNVNRALDLFEEMRTRRPFPLTPNAETYNYLIYACSRMPETHLKAWDFFLEAQAQGFELDSRSFQVLLYLCGQTGELVVARALIRNLAARSLALVDDFAVNSLMTAYRLSKPGPSPISASDTGRSIRASIMKDDGAFRGEEQIPFLPVSELDSNLVVLESSAMMEFFAEQNPAALTVTNPASVSKSPVIFNFLRIAVEKSDLAEFKRRYNRFTLPAPTRLIDAGETVQSPAAVPREHDFYGLAMKAAIKFRSLEFGREVWTERGEWRHSPEFRSLPAAERNNSDFKFARDLVELLAVCGEVEQAVLLARSAKKLGHWRRHHLTALIDVCTQMEDHKSLRQIRSLVHKS